MGRAEGMRDIEKCQLDLRKNGSKGDCVTSIPKDDMEAFCPRLENP